MAASGKKQKKLKGKTVELSVFLADEQRGLPGGPGSSIVRPRPTFNSWADEVESQDPEAGDYPEIPYKAVIDRSMLPTAPRAARGPDIDLETVPKAPPFVAYIGNLPYDLEQDKIYKFFLKLKVSNIRLPTEKGRLRGFGYVDFEDRDSLIEALSMNDDMIQGRKIRIALPGNMDREDRRGGADEDRTDCDWRRGGGGESNDGFDGGERSNDGFGDRDHGGGFGDRDRDRGGGFGDRDRDRGGFGSAAPESGRWERMGPPGNAERTDRYESAPSDDNQKWDRGHKVDSSRGDRWGDRGGNDRWGSRSGGDDNWGNRGGNDRWGSRGGDDSWGNRGGNDRWNDRRGADDRNWGGDRDRGYGGDRDRGYGGSRYRDDDRGGYGGRRNYGSDRGYERRGGGGGGGGYGGDGGDRAERSERTTSRDSSREPPRDRPKLQLQPRTKPKESVPEKTSSIFGGARPVDTSQREKEIEERLRKQDDIKPRDEEKENLGGDSNKRNDRPYRADGDRESRRERRLSSNSSQSKGIKPAPLHQSRTRRDSNNSNTSDAFSDEREEKPAPPSPRKEDAPAKMVPAPPPKENIWERRKTEQKGPKDHSINEMDSNRENDRRSISSDDDNKRGGGRDGKAHPKEKEMPKSYEEMPQFEDSVKKDWTDANKFNFLDNEEDEEYQENLS